MFRAVSIHLTPGEIYIQRSGVNRISPELMLQKWIIESLQPVDIYDVMARKSIKG